MIQPDGKSKVRVRVEFWMWLGKELGDEFKRLSDMRSMIELEVEEGVTVQGVLERLAENHPVVDQRIFSREQRALKPDVIATLNGHPIPAKKLEERTVKEGDKITILPFYSGG